MPPRPFPVDAVVTGIAIAYRNTAQTLIADAVLPRVPVPGEKYKWTAYPVAESFTVPDTRVGRRGRVNRVSFSGSEQSGAVNDYGLEDGIPVSDIEEAANMRARGLGTYDPELRSAEGLTDLILLDREVRVASVVQNPSNYAASRRIALSGSSMLSDPTSDIVGTLKTGFAATQIFRPNTMVMGRDVWTAISSHPRLVKACRNSYSGEGIVTPQEVANLFAGEGLKQILVGESFVNTARRGQPLALNRVWGKSIELLYIDPNPKVEQGSVTWGFTAQYGTRIGGRMADPNVGLEGGTVVRVGERVQEQVVAPDVGYLIQNAVQ